jgi:hypothetical protein
MLDLCSDSVEGSTVRGQSKVWRLPKYLTPHPLTAWRVCTPPPAFGAGGGQTRWVERGWGFNILEDARHCSVLYIRKYFVSDRFSSISNLSQYFFKIYLEKKNVFSQQLFSGLEQAEDKILMLMTNP